MLDFYAPNGFRVKIYYGNNIYVSHPRDDRILGMYTPQHGTTVHVELPLIMVETREAIAYGRKYLNDRESFQSE